MKKIRSVTNELAEGPVKKAGLKLRQIYDETEYINSSISLGFMLGTFTPLYLAYLYAKDE